MIRRSVKLQLLAFALLTVVGVSYAGVNYIGVGSKLFNKPYHVTVVVPSSGGIFTNAEVTVRGVTAGRVSGLHLHGTGVAVDLAIDHGRKIPADVKAVVANLSAVGEQYVDLRPQTDGPPYLHDGSVITEDASALPIDDATLLLNLDKFVNSVDRNQLTEVISALDDAFAGTGPDLQRLIDSGNSLTKSLQDALPQTIKLINDGKTALDTQRAVSGDLKSFSADLASLSEQIRKSDPDLRGVLSNGIVSAQQVQALLQDNEGTLPVLLGNLVTLGEIQSAPIRLNGLRTMLTIYPGIVFNGFKGAPGDGFAHFGAVNDNTPVCQTYAPSKNAPGYIAPSDRRDPTSKAGLEGPAKINTYCLLPKDSATDVRGARNAPRPPGDTTDRPYPGQPAFSRVTDDSSIQQGTGTLAGRSSGQSSGAGGSANSDTSGNVGTYDPLSGLVTAPGGQDFLLGSNGGQGQLLGNDAWAWLLIAPTTG